MRTVIYNANIVSQGNVLLDSLIMLEGERIQYVDSMANSWEFLSKLKDIEFIDAEHGFLVPGFIDVHIHGGFGHDFMDATEEAFEEIAKYHANNGTTAMLATSMTSSFDNIRKVLDMGYRMIEKKGPHAQILGVHLEGPFVSTRYPGAQNTKYMVSPDVAVLNEWADIYPGLIKMITLAPEKENGIEFIQRGVELGMIMACGHTDARKREMEAAIDAGLKHSVHMFNGMRPLHHREPGTAGTILAYEQLSTEIIADGFHVDPLVIRLLTMIKNKNNLLLITDAMSASGLGDGIYDLGGQDVIVTGREARLTEGGSLAGSTLTMIDAFRFMVQQVGITVAEVSLLASWNPAKLLGIEQMRGDLAKDYIADVVWMTPELGLKEVWVNGIPLKLGQNIR